MVDAVAQKVASQELDVNTSKSVQKVSAETQEHFNNAMNVAHDNVAHEVNAISEVQAQNPHTPTLKTPGDSILDSMQREMTDKSQALEKSINSVQGSSGDMLRLQYEVAQLTMTQTVVGQVGSKTSQGLQQLLKGQG